MIMQNLGNKGEGNNVNNLRDADDSVLIIEKKRLATITRYCERKQKERKERNGSDQLKEKSNGCQLNQGVCTDQHLY